MMKQKQTGASMYVLIVLLLIVVLLAKIGISTIPDQVDHYYVKRIVADLVEGQTASTFDEQAFERELSNRFSANGVNFKTKDQLFYDAGETDLVIILDYQTKTKFFKNISFVSEFYEEIVVE